ncbi:DUF1549 and DUF1553 domain-containing protein [Singulisphaera sp. Ch08]|uniref:DUF1549 and DUF1553 domain-containing protein n=1 Tax=Singulisphaera sp. Ch08 TaxID=3120278 RepID=A0AAU7CQR5_9BACT
MEPRRWRSSWIGLVAVLGFGNVAHAVSPPDFATRVIPVLTKAGCNAGSCHGAALGRGGFRLSLLGYDPDVDHESLVQEFEGRRVNTSRPERSLALRKATGNLDHEGGTRLARGGEGYRIVRDWIAGGALRGAGGSPRSLRVEPAATTLPATGQSVPLNVIASFEDGTTEDVTRWAVYTPADPTAVQCSPLGEVTVLRRGRAAIMVRFLGAVGCATVTVPLADAPARVVQRLRANFIDDHINRTLEELGLDQTPRADDASVLRRIRLDLTGQLPTPKEVDDFLADRSPGKLARLVDQLLANPEFVDHWAYKWGDLLRIESGRLGTAGATAFHTWIRDQIVRNTPLDRMVRELVLALGDGDQVGPANFSRVPGDARSQAEFVSQVFLGVRLQCANCHDHPLDRWTQDDYHGLAAIFARLDHGREVRLRPRGEVIHPGTGLAAAPRIPGDRFLKGEVDPREAFAQWLTASKNPYLARSVVNRIWRELMGRGLVEPVDDHRTTNPATHPALLNELARDFIASDFDTKHVIRTIMASEAYRRESGANPGRIPDDQFYSHALARPLPPHVLVDAVTRVTGVAEPLGNLPVGTTAGSLGDSRVPSTTLDLLGRCPRESGCATTPGASGSLALALHAINGTWLNGKIAAPDGRLHRLLREGRSDPEIVVEFYRIALGREPTDGERTHWKREIAAGGEAGRTDSLEDFVWALILSAEFTQND